jgi:hypothetical protein
MTDTIDDVDEHPIIFNEWSIQRILEGEKTQTRRVVRPQPADGVECIRHVKGDFWQANEMCSEWDPTLWQSKCPYGTPGDVLWVREAFRLPADNDGKETPKEQVQRGVNCWYYEATEEYTFLPGADWGRLRPAIHMPRELCRLRLRVEDVRVERVQEISGKDARAEGCLPDTQSDGAARLELFHKWEDIHGEGAWERNDWVWVITFSRIDNA